MFMLATESTPAPTENPSAPWQWLAAQVDTAAYCPVADPGVLAEHVVDPQGSYYVLKNPALGAYLKLDEADYALWQLMDGSRTVKALVVAYFLKHHTFAYGRVAALVEELKQEHFLLDKPVGVLKQAARQLAQKDWRYRWLALAQFFVEHRFPVNGLDKAITRIYKSGGFLFFTPVWQILMAVVALVGLDPFIRMLKQPELFPVIGVRQGNYLLGLILLLLANTILIFFHELAHALTTKHYGREVPSGGAMIYFGMPAFYVNTMDIWLEPRKHRLAVSWMGPFSGLFLGGLSSGLALWTASAGHPLPGQFFFKMAFLGYVGFLVNMNPLLELDGYFILMDALGIPMLRERALTFIKTELPGKIKILFTPARTKAQNQIRLFTREELIFTVFGLLSAAYTLYVIWFTLFLWNNRFVRLLANLWTEAGWLGRGVVIVLAIVVFIPAGLALGVTVWKWAETAFTWLNKRGFFEREQNVAVLSVFGGIILIVLPWLTWGNQGRGLAIWLVLPAAVAVWSLIITAGQYTGSEILPGFGGLAVAAVFLLGATLAQAMDYHAVVIWLGRLAVFPLAVAGLVNLSGLDLRRCHRLELAAMMFLLPAGFFLAIILSRQSGSVGEALLAGGSCFALFIFLAAIIPTLVAHRRTRFLLPWSWLVVGTILSGGLIFNFLPRQNLYFLMGAVTFWAVGGVMYALAGLRLRFPARSAEQKLSLSEEERLRRAFGHFFETLFAGFSNAFGSRRAESVDDDLDVIAVTANWDVELDQGRVRDRLDLNHMTILQQAGRYQEVLGRAIDLMDNWSGRKFITQAAQAAYDSLPWPERETLGRYVLAGTPWGAAIARQFASARGEQFQLLRNLPLFARFSNEAMDDILAAARRETMPAGVILARQGKPYTQFVLVIGGKVDVWKASPSTGHSLPVGELHRGAAFGLPVFYAGPMPAEATYQTATPCDLLVIALGQVRHLQAQGISFNNHAAQSSRLGRMLAQMPLFAELSSLQIETLVQKMGRFTVPAGEVIIRQGQARQYFYVIEQGEVGVMAAGSNGAEELVAKLGQGEHFGETALYINQPYDATCKALTEVHLLTLDEFTFDRLVATSHQMSHYVEQVSSGRLKDTRRKLGIKQLS